MFAPHRRSLAQRGEFGEHPGLALLKGGEFRGGLVVHGGAAAVQLGQYAVLGRVRLTRRDGVLRQGGVLAAAVHAALGRLGRDAPGIGGR